MPRQPVSLRRELLLGLAMVAGSLALLPALIYLVGTPLFGAYQGGLQQFYLNLWRGLTMLSGSAWTLALAPTACVLILRGLLRRPQPDNESEPS